MLKSIVFNTKGHDSFIDFIKAYAIVCVLIGHSCLPLSKMAYGVWAGVQVPLFILIQSFHCYKNEKPSVKIGKIMKRVFLPFLLIEIIVFIFALLFTEYNCNMLLHKFLEGGVWSWFILSMGLYSGSNSFACVWYIVEQK